MQRFTNMVCALLLGAAGGVLACSVDSDGVTIDAKKANEAAQRTQERVVEGAKVAGDRLGEVGADLERAAGQVEGAVGRAAEAVAPGDDAAVIVEAAHEIHCKDDACTVTAAYATKLRAQPAVLATQAKLQPETRSGRVIGMRLTECKQLPELFGLRAGDVIARINGIAITSMQSVPTLYLQLRAARRFTIEYERAGESKTLVVDVV